MLSFYAGKRKSIDGLYTIQRYHRVVNFILKGPKSQGGQGF